MEIRDQLNPSKFSMIPFDQHNDIIVKHIKKTLNQSGPDITVDQAWYKFCSTYKIIDPTIFLYFSKLFPLIKRYYSTNKRFAYPTE